MSDPAILVTGGAGYIGSHAVQRLLREGRHVVVVDNLFRGHRAAMTALQGGPRESGRGGGRLTFVEGDIGDAALVSGLLREHDVREVMHFAAVAYVGESVDDPLWYYRNNTAAALTLLEACDQADGEGGVDRFVFSSTCATYGEPPPGEVPIRETCEQRPINPYGRSKLMVEKMLLDLAEARRRAGKPFAFAALRYFNVAGSDRGGTIGEDHRPETHLIPIVLQVALGQREHVTVFGTDYQTPDGTCIRDYIHVEDLIDAHVRVMEALEPTKFGSRTYNLGIGRGYSVREVIEACRRVTGREIAVREGERRAGDPPTLYADASKIQQELGWSAQITDLDEIIASAWRWMREHPHGYEEQ